MLRTAIADQFAARRGRWPSFERGRNLPVRPTFVPQCQDAALGRLFVLVRRSVPGSAFADAVGARSGRSRRRAFRRLPSPAGRPGDA